MPFIPNTQISNSGLLQTYVGNTTIGASFESMVTSRMYAKKITISTNGFISDIEAYLKGNGSNVASLTVALLADNAGVPDKILSFNIGFQDIIGLTTTPGWVGMAIGKWVTPGDYWLVVFTNDGTNNDAGQLAYDSGSDQIANTGGAWLDDGGFTSWSNSTRSYNIRANFFSAVTLVNTTVEVAYTEFTSNVSVTATAEGSANTVVTASPFVADGSTAYLVEFQTGAVEAVTGQALKLWLYLDGSSIGQMSTVFSQDGTNFFTSIRVSRRLVPNAGTRTFSVRATTGGGTATVYGDVGGSGQLLPGFIRIMRVT